MRYSGDPASVSAWVKGQRTIRVCDNITSPPRVTGSARLHMVVDEGLVLNVPPSSPSARRFFSTLATLSCTETAVRVATHPVVEALRETHGKYASVLRVWAPCRTGIMTRRNASRLEAAQAAEPGAGAGGEN